MEPSPDQRLIVDEENFVGDYFDELKRLETFVNEDFLDNDYDLELGEDDDERAVTTPAADRSFGGTESFKNYGREQRGSTTNITDMPPEIDSRAVGAMPVFGMATPIESTQQDLPQLFGLGGHTGPLQAKSEMKQGDSSRRIRRTESKIQLDILVMKREALRKDAEVAKQMSFVMSSLDSVIRLKQGKPETTKDTTAMRAMLDYKVPIKIMKRATSVQVENSLYNFKGALEQMGLKDVAEGKVIGSTDEETRIKRAALRWIGDDERMLSSIRTKLGQEAKGTILLEHIITYYIEPMIGDSRNAETKFQAFDYLAMFGGDEENMHKHFDEFVNIVSHLSAKRQGDSAEWVQYLSDRVPADLYTEYDRFLRTLTTSQQRKACEDVTAFALYLGKALTRLRERTPPNALTLAPTQGDHLPPSMNMHGQRREGKMERLPDVIPGHPRLVDSMGKAFNACPDCAFKGCPKANDPKGICDVCDEVPESRVAQLAKGSDFYKEKVDKKRVLLNKKPIDYGGMKSNTHERKLMWGDEMFDLIDSLAEEDVADESVEEEAPQSDFKGFRQEFFEARKESALRLGTYEDE